MTSPAQASANRANAQLSTGPVTEAGKQTVSQNSLKHGLTGSVHAALPGEQDAFEQHCDGYRKVYAPVGVPEQELVRNIAENYWHLKRAHAMETALFIQIEMEQADDLTPSSAHAQAWIDPVKGLQRIALYAGRIQRAIEKNTAELKAMQAQRKTLYALAQEEAILLTQLAEAKGQTVDATKDFPSPELCGGFVYSASEIARIISRARRLEEARMRFAPQMG
jgi:hypothetical protein